MGVLVVKLLDATCSLDELLVRPILDNSADNCEQQETEGSKTLETGTGDKGNDRVNCHDREEAGARAHDDSGSEEGDKVDDDSHTGNTVADRKLTLRCKVERAMFWLGVWGIGWHSVTIVHIGRAVWQAFGSEFACDG